MAKRPGYRLQALLDVRQRAERDHERALGAAAAAYRLELERQRQMEAELARMVGARDEKKREYGEKALRGRSSAREIAAAQAYLGRLLEQQRAQERVIATQRAVVSRNERELAWARAALVEARRAVEALQKHRDELVRRWDRERQTREEEAMDELAEQVSRKDRS